MRHEAGCGSWRLDTRAHSLKKVAPAIPPLIAADVAKTKLASPVPMNKPYTPPRNPVVKASGQTVSEVTRGVMEVRKDELAC